MNCETMLYPEAPEELYPLLYQQLEALTRDMPHRIANLANASAVLMEALKEINWVGFYLMEGQNLVLGPFQGKPACIEIPVGRGVCGRAVETGQTQLVADVHAFPGHIACDSASRSEIVVPLYRDGQVAAVLDVDSPLVGRFSQADKEGLESLRPILEGLL
ncbi:MAG: GAF domain-containing protein [Faecousia sp.]